MDIRQNKLIICLGPVCSGKTTWSLNYLKQNPLTFRFCYDEFLYMTKGNGICNSEVMDTAIVTICSFLMKGDVVLDSFPIHFSHLRQLLEFSDNSMIRLFDVNFGDSVIRSITRKEITGRSVSIDEMKRYYLAYKKFLKSNYFAQLCALTNVVIDEAVDANLTLIM